MVGVSCIAPRARHDAQRKLQGFHWAVPYLAVSPQHSAAVGPTAVGSSEVQGCPTAPGRAPTRVPALGWQQLGADVDKHQQDWMFGPMIRDW